MSATVRERPPRAVASNGGVPARRAVVRWAWRLLRREWRQQLLILALITVAVAATFVGSAVATNTPPPAGAGFGTATDLATFPSLSPHARRRDRGTGPPVRPRRGDRERDVPGARLGHHLQPARRRIRTVPFGQPMLSLASGHYPAGPGQVDVTSGLASAFGLKIGDTWRRAGAARRVVGIVTNPQNLLDEFALVAPGQVSPAHSGHRCCLTLRVCLPARSARTAVSRASAVSTNVLNPVTISLAAATLGMLLIALVAVGGFTVLAQRRLRSIGMLGAQGATDASVRLVVSANGLATGAVGAGGRVRSGPRRVAGVPPARGSQRSPCHRGLPAALAGDLRVDGAGRAGGVSRGRPARPRDRQGAARRRACGAAAGAAGGLAAGPGRPAPCSLLLAFFLIGLASEQSTSAAAESGNNSKLFPRPHPRPDNAVRRGGADRPCVPGAAGRA